ncbi:DAK1/DegV-like protein [Marasmius fiardii PR-910]|nr:DAK1/DegV-like protein [Marasmius fiardii PR-910]
MTSTGTIASRMDQSPALPKILLHILLWIDTFSDHAKLAIRSFKGVVTCHPDFAVIPALRTVYNAAYDPDKVSLVCGGGLDMSLAPQVSLDEGFSLLVAKQVLGAIRKVASNRGIIVVITNDTSNNLHFGLAVQQAALRVLPYFRSATNVSFEKFLVLASELSLSFSSVLRLCQTVTSSIVFIAGTLGRCHVPGRDNAKYSIIRPRTIEIGLGHNEPGAFVVEQPPPKQFVAHMFDLCPNQQDKERAFVPFTYGQHLKASEGDEVVLFVNNMGGMSVLEMYVVVDEAVSQLEKLNLRVRRSFCGLFMTSLNAPGFSLTVWNLTYISRLMASIEKDDELKSDPSGALFSHESDKRTRELVEFEEDLIRNPEADERKIFGFVLLFVQVPSRSWIPNLNLSSGIPSLGDDDCGETCANGAKAILEALDEGLGNDGEGFEVLHYLAQKIIPPTIDIPFWGVTASRAIETLKLGTKARVGHRTAMDALIPFAAVAGDSSVRDDEKLAFSKAEQACRSGEEGTASLEAKLGRATYVREDNVALPPDPGAMSLVALARGVGR